MKKMYAVTGAAFDDSRQGSTYIFYCSGSAWTQKDKLVAGDGAASEYYGNSVSMSGDTVVIRAAQRDSVSSSLSDSGSAHVFVFGNELDEGSAARGLRSGSK